MDDEEYKKCPNCGELMPGNYFGVCGDCYTEHETESLKWEDVEESEDVR